MVALPPVSAVIPNRDGAHLLRRTLPPLLRELPAPGHEVLVVDDASEDDSVAVLAREFPNVRVVALEANVGFGEACNQGLRAATHETVLLLNSDMEVSVGSLERLNQHLASPDVFAVGPQYVSDRPGERRAFADEGPVITHIGAPAGGGLLRRGVFLELGGFDPLYYPFYWEDMDLGWAAWRSGYRVVHDLRVEFRHLESATIKRLYPAQYVARVRARNRCLFGWKWLEDRGLVRLHRRVVMRRTLGDLARRHDAASLLGLWDALRMRPRAMAARPTTTAQRTDVQILTAAAVDPEMLFGI